MSNRSLPRASTSSTARAPAIPFPTTTSLCFDICLDLSNAAASLDFQEPDIDDEAAGYAGRRRQQNFEPGFGENVLGDDERHVLARFRAHREVAHRLTVAHQQEIDELAARI